MPVSSIILNSETLSLTEGDEFKLTATVSPSNATDKAVVWSSSDATIASVKDGLVSAVKAGKATITVTSLNGGAKASCTVTVSSKAIAVQSITLNQTKVEMTVGESLALTATVKPDDATDKAVTWKTSDANIALVDQSGKVTAIGEGSATITAKAGDKEATCLVTVTIPVVPVESITLDQASVSLEEGQTITLTATVKPDNATDKTVTWNSSNEEIATVNPHGVVTALQPGIVTVTAAIGDKIATCTITVRARFSANKYLTFISEGTTRIFLSNEGGNSPLLYYSYDKKEWIKWDYGWLDFTRSEPLYICGDNPEGFSHDYNKRSQFFSSRDNFSISGDVMALISKDEDVIRIPSKYCFFGLFSGCRNLLSAPDLPATTLSTACYLSMFSGCESLTSAPELPANTLSVQCYKSMFYNCTSLIEAPKLSATSLAEGCYSQMFVNCISLSEMPVLPATTLAPECYSTMFQGCTNLTTTSALPAMILERDCYSGMFSGCSNLTTASALPAMILERSCYSGMFSGCSNLTTAPDLPATTLAAYCYERMFEDCSCLHIAPELPATVTVYSCYLRMFSGCSSLSAAPKLPATTMTDNCYYGMFYGCSNLTTAPDLPATTLAISCYESMFEECTSLVTAPPILPALSLRPSCYSLMFNGCTSLTTAPELPAMTLANSCYANMFCNCYSLKTAPDLPAIQLPPYCYRGMFENCRNLTYVKCLANNVIDTMVGANCVSDWMYGVADNGTFVKSATMEDWPKGSSGIPEGWTVVDAE